MAVCIECDDGRNAEKCGECGTPITEHNCWTTHYTTCQCMTCGGVYQESWLLCTQCAKGSGQETT